jgi:hypothetical protein
MEQLILLGCVMTILAAALGAFLIYTGLHALGSVAGVVCLIVGIIIVLRYVFPWFRLFRD